MIKQPVYETLTLTKIVGGGQTLGQLEDGRKAFVWGGLPGESVTMRVTKKKSHFLEGVVTEVHTASSERVEPLDPESYLSTSPWQIMNFEAEQHYKAALIEEAFELHDIVLPNPIEVYTDNRTSHYRNKVEFSWYSTGASETQPSDEQTKDKDSESTSSDDGSAFPAEASQERKLDQDATSWPESEEVGDASDSTLDLAFFRRGSRGKITIEDCSLLPKPIMVLAHEIRDLLQAKGVEARYLKTLLIRCDQSGNCVWQLYLKGKIANIITTSEAKRLTAQGGELIYSDPRSPASRITKRLTAYGDVVLSDSVLDVPFHYATEGFFQVNIPVYEQALRDMKQWVQDKPVVDLYSGVGSIGLTIGGSRVTLVEINEDAVREMKRNITALGREGTATAILSPSEKALDTISSDSCVVLDPPRAGLHANVVAKLLEAAPERIIYLSCNPVTQARDIALLSEKYGIRHHRGYNFFPRTPHIENLVILEQKP